MPDQAISFGPFRLIPSQRLLLEGNSPLRVGNRALTILQILAERAGEVVDKRELARLVWPDTFVEEANIRVHVAALRRALGDGQNGARYIVNIPGRGYRFTAAVSILSEPTKSDREGARKPQPAATLPSSITRLVGRAEAASKLMDELTRERMVTVVGPAGIGKTSLALAAAQSWSRESVYAAYFVDLAAVSDPGGVSETFTTTAVDSADPMPKLRAHRMMSRALSDLGEHVLAQQQVEMALQPAREEVPQAHLNAYEIDHWIASRAVYARILWLRGYPDDAKKEAETCIAQALRLGHEQSTCWALAFNVCPIAIWRGELAEASHFANLLLEHSQSVFQHWHEWGLLYQQFLREADSRTEERNESRFKDLNPTLPAQADLLATFDIKLAGPNTLARAQADEDIWCAAEILRAWTDRHVTGDAAGRSGSEAPLAHSLEIARRQGAKSWELRAATSLAFLLRGSARTGQARDTLQSVLSHFTQGRATKDVQAAIDLLSQL